MFDQLPHLAQAPPSKTKRPFLRTSLAGGVPATGGVLLRLLRWGEEGGGVVGCCTEAAGVSARSLRCLAEVPRRFFLPLLAATGPGAGALPAMNAGRMVNTNAAMASNMVLLVWYGGVDKG